MSDAQDLSPVQPVSLLLLDINMAVMSGIETLVHVKEMIFKFNKRHFDIET